MDFNETLEFIHGIPRFNKELGLEKIKTLLNLMGNPQDKLKFVHVAGTNGKGSTCTMLSYILKEAGYKTGLYISPFVIEFSERIQIDNQMIPKEELAGIGTKVRTFWEEIAKEGEPPSEFEVVLAIALEHFVRSGCDVVVLEVGMGGRLDATNVIPTTLVSVITSISIDHTQYLGDTIGKITKEKAGIIKHGGITVCYPQQEVEALAVIMEECALKNNELIIPHSVEVLEMSLAGTKIRYNEKNYYIPLIGEHQVYNTLTVLEVCKALEKRGIKVGYEAELKGISETRFPSRLEILSQNPLIILDGAHNAGGVQTLAKALEMVKDRKIVGIMGMVSDKDIEQVISIIGEHFSSVVTTWDEANPRFLEPEKLSEIIGKYCKDVKSIRDPKEAYKFALSKIKNDDVLVICGSLYLGSILRQIVKDDNFGNL